MKVLELINKLEKYATIKRAFQDDEVGLIVGNVEDEIKGVVVTMALTEDIINEALNLNSNVIISYEPILFDRIKNKGFEYNLITRLIKNDINLYVMHTNLDVTDNGYAGAIAYELELSETKIINVTYKEKCYKLVSCVPVEDIDYTDKIRKALGEIGVADGYYGAGYVGLYSEVSDYSVAYQWFKTMPGANPYIGRVGDLAKVESNRFEMIIPEHQLNECIDKLIEIHPYEVVEYDIYPLEETRNHRGIGRTGILKSEISVADLIKIVKENLKIKNINISKLNKNKIKRVSIYSEVNNSIVDYMIKDNVDVLITDHIDNNSAVKLVNSGILVIKVDFYSLRLASMTKLFKYINEIGINTSMKCENVFD